MPTTTAASHSESNYEVPDDLLADAMAVIANEDLKDLDVEALLAYTGEDDAQETPSISAFNEFTGASVSRDLVGPKAKNEDRDVGAALLDAAAYADGLCERTVGADSGISSSSAVPVHRPDSTSAFSTSGSGSLRAIRSNDHHGAQDDDDIMVIEEKPVMKSSERKRRHEAARSANAIEELEKKFYRFLKAYHRVAEYAEFSMNESGDPKKFVAKRGVMKQWIEFNTKQN